MKLRHHRWRHWVGVCSTFSKNGWKWVHYTEIKLRLSLLQSAVFYTSLYRFVRTFANSVYSCLNMVIIKSFLYSIKRDLSRDLIEMTFIRSHPGPLASITPLIRPDIIMGPCWLAWNWFYFLWWLSGKGIVKNRTIKRGWWISVTHVTLNLTLYMAS